MADTALHDLTLAEASTPIKARKLSPVEYTQALLARTDAFEPQLKDRARQLAWSTARRSLRRQGHLRHGRRPHVRTLADLHQSRTARRCNGSGEASGRRRGADGQACHTRVRARRTVVRLTMAPCAQSLEHGALYRRLFVWIGDRDCVRSRAGKPWLRYRRFDSWSFRTVRHSRAQAHLWPRQPRRRAPQLLLLRSLRAHGADGRRLRTDTQCDCRPRSRRCRLCCPFGGFHCRPGPGRQRSPHRRNPSLLGNRSTSACSIGAMQLPRAA
jgi:hypothetical protein